MTNGPIERIQDGWLEAAIWKNGSKKGAFHNVTLNRTYKQDGDYKSTNSLGRGDLLSAARLLQKAYDRVSTLDAEERQQAAGGPEQ